MGALLLPGHPARFARAALIEGGYGSFDEWMPGAARRFHGGGGRGCSSRAGEPTARRRRARRGRCSSAAASRRASSTPWGPATATAA